MHARAFQVTNTLTIQKKILHLFFLRSNNTDFPFLTRQVSSVPPLFLSILCFIFKFEEHTSNPTPIKCRMAVVMVVLTKEAMVVQTGVIRTGTVTIRAIPPLATPVLETILQSIPSDTNILGLDLKFRFEFVGRLSIFWFSQPYESFVFVHPHMLDPEFANATYVTVEIMDTLGATVIRTVTADTVAPLMAMEVEDMVEVPATRWPTLALAWRRSNGVSHGSLVWAHSQI